MLNTSLTRRRAVSLALTSGFALALSACGKDTPAATSTPTESAAASAPASGASSAAASGASSAASSAAATPSVKPTVIDDLAALTVKGDPGKAPSVTAKWPLAVEKTMVKPLSVGTGPVVPKGANVTVNYHGVNGRDGKVFDESFSKGQPATFPLTGVVAGFTKAIEGQKVGSRVLVMMTSADGYPDGRPPSILKGDCLIFVIDILDTSLSGPSGEAVAAKPGLPEVKDVKGVPEVTIPKTAAPKDLVVQPIVKGKGKKVAATDAITVHYRAWNWADGKKLIDDYATEGGESGLLNTTIEAWQKGLVGQTVGSRVLLVAPPAMAFGDQGNEGIPKNATLVYVVDILYTQAGTQG